MLSDHDSMHSVVLTVFCGRQRYLSILLKYIKVLLERHIIQECHLWDFTRELQDHKYLMTLSGHQSDKRIKLVHVTNKSSFSEYYQFYANTYADNEVIVIKTDDDIVYIDVDAMPAFIAFRIANPHFFLCFPEIINNGLCAHLQQRVNYSGNKIPTDPHTFEIKQGGWETLVGDGNKGAWLHDWFIDGRNHGSKKRVTTPEHITLDLNQRISINMFAILSKDLHILAQPRITEDDEHNLTVVVTSDLQRANAVCTSFTVSHFGFGTQRDTGLGGGVETRLLKRYDELAAKEIPTVGVL